MANLHRLFAGHWAISQSGMDKMVAIAQNHKKIDLEALEAKIGQKLDHTYAAYDRDGVAILPMDGPLFPKANIFTSISGATSLEMVARDLTIAEENSAIHSIVLKADSPGGLATYVDEFYSLVANCSKPVYTHVSGDAGSAMYWIASASEKIFLSPISLVGSIGVVRTLRPDPDEGELVFVSSVSPKKRLDPESKEGRDDIMATVNNIAEVFVDNVAAGRGTSFEDVAQNFGQGGMLIGQSAVDAGMADRVCTFEELLADLSDREHTTYGASHFTGDNQMNVKELKADHEGLYNEVFAAGASSAEPLRADATTVNSIADMQVKVDDLTAANKDLEIKATAESEDHAAKSESYENRIKTLEKRDIIREEAAITDQAKDIVTTSLQISTIPARLHKRVRANIDHNAFVEEGKLDVGAYSDHVKAEVADWAVSFPEGTLPEPLLGFGDGGEESDVDAMVKVDEAADRLLAHIQ